jgi:DNA polymerase-3 subunit delta'
LDEGTLLAALETRLPDMKQTDRRTLARLAEGSLGLALRLSSEDGLELAYAAQSLLTETVAADAIGALALADKVARTTDDGLAQFGQFLCQAIADRVRARAQAGEGRALDQWVTLWERLRMVFARADALHLEPRQTVLSSVFAIDEMKRQTGAI